MSVYLQMHFVRPDLNQNFKEALVGVIVTNSWLFIEGLEFLLIITYLNTKVYSSKIPTSTI